ncbi:MAG: tetratricopeptide repeat protein [Candidatus Omnitrophica bacterium]|nr:tetratricopeptide repeat protein [Candidatus Omnitrophota bacterium]
MLKFKRTASTILIYCSIWFLTSGFLETTSGLNQKGNKQYEEKHYTSALESYRKAQIKNPDEPSVRYNLGTTLYQLDQFQEAETHLHQALEKANRKDLQATAWYNYGNTQYRLGQFDKAAEAYRKTLDLNPNDKDAKYNLELLQKKKSIFDLKQDKRDEDRQNNPPPQQQEQQQKQQGGGSEKDQDQNKSQAQNQQDQASQGQNQQEGEASDQQKEEEGQQTQDEQEGEQKESDQQKEGQEESDQKQTEISKVQGQELQPQPLKPVELEGGQEGQKREDLGGEEQKPLFQGQMSQENALRILDALRESEQELQQLRQPRRQTDHEPLKDW